MKEFNEDGNLQPGIHNYTVEEFERQFVNPFKYSDTRQDIYNNLSLWIHKLSNVVIPQFIWLDGSYLTMKINPNDIDLVVFYKPEDIPDEETAMKLKHIINNESRSLRCDSYLCYTLEHIANKKNIPNDLIMLQTYWMGQYGFDREKRAKGLINLSQMEILKLGGRENVIHSVQ